MVKGGNVLTIGLMFMKKKQYRIICKIEEMHQKYMIQMRRQWFPIWRDVESHTELDDARMLVRLLQKNDRFVQRGEIYRSNWE